MVSSTPIPPDETFMELALLEARKGVGQTSPNPAVGAVIVVSRNGRPEVVARGWHRRAGEAHAEVEALRALPEASLARGATLYVTLEPCSTHGRTPPCTGAIIRAGIRRVVIGTLDPNPAHAGRALGLLQQAGIEVTHGVLETACRRLNRAFNHWIVTGGPWVTAKAGFSLDGRITRAPGTPRWITSELSRADTHRHRAEVDAILIGGGTLRDDNPQLTVRGVSGARQPWRVVVTQSGNLPADATLFTDEHRERTLVFTGKPLREVLVELGQRGVTSVMIEGGMRVLGEAFDERLVHEVCFYMAPLLLGGPKVVIGGEGVGSYAEAWRIVDPKVVRLGGDLKLSGELAWGERP
ncbi:MAG TPA: bifunctional diaminohydroxyphosphoribosylaminopyrimidine deaminase/5-amino-6-(5-phosphoribosylamino)uracil reductase RibD [Chthoniobacteraceae bacterium]|nr:bifunctional diaminohydroxyphosphoribosylaminopyrimidine deaminase/5-amino-6-(5-phosphoribosylamino)uracil reductase RibD [Chthoniobacteraceae bacterium]